MLSFVPPNSCVEILPPLPKNVTLFGSRVIAGVISKAKVILKEGELLIYYDWVSLWKEEIWTDTQDNGGRDWSDVFTG